MKKWLKIILGVTGGIIVLFAIDIICIYTINRPLLAIKENNGKVYKGIFYDIYNCDEFSAPQIKAKNSKFTCAIKYNTIEEKYEPTEIDGVTMTIKEGTLTHKRATIIIKDENGKGKYVYGTSFRIDKKVDGKWVSPKRTNNTCAFNSMAYFVDDNGYLEFEQDWDCMYSSLENGTYRLVKDTFLESSTPITEKDIKYFSVEFTIDDKI